MKKIGEIAKNVGGKAISGLKATGEKAVYGLKETGGNMVKSTKEATKNAFDKTMDMLDATGDDKFDIKDIIVICLKTPLCIVKREEFLRRELSKHCMPDIVSKAIEATPLEAGVTADELDEIAKSVISIESKCVTGTSVALGVASNLSLGASIPTDIIQYYVYVLRTVQKLIYLYGFSEIILTEDENKIDDDILNFFAICLGVMYDVAGASDVLRVMVDASRDNKDIFGTDGVMAKPIMYKILEATGKSLTRKVVSGVISNIVPVVGGVVNGGITYISFQPNCNRLRKALKNASVKHLDIEEKITGENNAVIRPIDDEEAKIRRYKALLDEGILTQEEFDLKKKELLNL